MALCILGAGLHGHLSWYLGKALKSSNEFVAQLTIIPKSSSLGMMVRCSGTLHGVKFDISRLRQHLEMDSQEFSDLSLDLKETSAFHLATLQRVRTYLALDTKGAAQEIDTTISATRSSIVDEFAPMGHAAVQYCTLSKAACPLSEESTKEPLQQASENI